MKKLAPICDAAGQAKPSQAKPSQAKLGKQAGTLFKPNSIIVILSMLFSVVVFLCSPSKQS